MIGKKEDEKEKKKETVTIWKEAEGEARSTRRKSKKWQLENFDSSSARHEAYGTGTSRSASLVA